MAVTEEDVVKHIAAPLSDLGLLIEDVRILAAGVHRRLVITVDLAGDTTEAVSSDLVAQATRVISDIIDPLPLFGDRPYDLEVSSPGALRPLTEPRHFRRNRGRTVTVSLVEGPDVTGTIAEVTDTGIVLDPGRGQAPAELDYQQIASAKVVLKFR